MFSCSEIDIVPKGRWRFFFEGTYLTTSFVITFGDGSARAEVGVPRSQRQKMFSP